jgi:hypothetical protein
MPRTIVGYCNISRITNDPTIPDAEIAKCQGRVKTDISRSLKLFTEFALPPDPMEIAGVQQHYLLGQLN